MFSNVLTNHYDFMGLCQSIIGRSTGWTHHVLLVRCPISCQNPKTSTSPSLFLSTKLRSRSMTESSWAFRWKTEDTLSNTIFNQAWSSFDAIGYWSVGRWVTLTPLTRTPLNSCNISMVVWGDGLWVCLHLVANLIISLPVSRIAWNFPHLNRNCNIWHCALNRKTNTTTSREGPFKSLKGAKSFMANALLVLSET